MTREDNLREIKEAKAAGIRALGSLKNAKAYLTSASNWGWFDTLGGGFISGLMKHSKLGDAKAQMEQARQHLQSFQRELRDVNTPSSFQVHISDFLVFADFFFDGIIADWLVQSRIRDARVQVDEAIEKVETILNDLNSWERQLTI